MTKDRVYNSSGMSEGDAFDRDQAYWNVYYTVHTGQSEEPSEFAKSIVDKMIVGRHLLELGCGNGRDSLFFLKNGLKVTAVDASDVAINSLVELTKGNPSASFVCDDFVKCKSVYQGHYDYIYSRFTLHAISEEQEDELLINIRNAMEKHTILFIEARTVHDTLFGRGRPAGRNAYFQDGHYRRFIDTDRFRKKLERLGYMTLSLIEDIGFSKTQDSDPVLMRCIASLAYI